MNLATHSPAEIAAATALLNASLSMAVDPSVYTMSRDFLDGTATFFGMDLYDRTASGASVHSLVTGMLTASGIDVDRMQDHYYALCSQLVTHVQDILGIPHH